MLGHKLRMSLSGAQFLRTTLLVASFACEAFAIEMERQELLELVSRGEQAIDNFAFSLHLDTTKPGANGQLVPQKYSIQAEGAVGRGAEALYNVHTVARLCATENGRLVDAGEPMETAGSYDGKSSRTLSYGRHNPTDPFSPDGGLTMAEANYNNLAVFYSGIDLILPFFARLGVPSPELSAPRGLRHYLENHSGEGGDWRIEAHPSPEIVQIAIPYPGGRVWDVLELDLAKGAAISSYCLWIDYGKPSAKLSMEARCTLQEFDGIWLPVKIVRFNSGLRYDISITYSAVNASLAEDAFVLDWPTGIGVFDQTTGLAYTVDANGKMRERLIQDSLHDLTRLRFADEHPQLDVMTTEGTVSQSWGVRGRRRDYALVAVVAAGLLTGGATATWLLRKRHSNT